MTTENTNAQQEPEFGQYSHEQAIRDTAIRTARSVLERRHGLGGVSSSWNPPALIEVAAWIITGDCVHVHPDTNYLFAPSNSENEDSVYSD